MEYPVRMGDMEVGKITLEQKGLYYHYTGCILIEATGIYRIFAITGQNRINLGVCQPSNGRWITKGKVSNHQLSLTDTQFIVISHSSDQTDVFLVDEGNPFPYLEQLSQCRFTRIQNKSALTLISFINR